MLGNDRWRLVKRIFQQTVDLPQPTWPGYLDRICLGDSELRAEVESLLAEHVGGDALLCADADLTLPEPPSIAVDTTDPGGADLVRVVFGPAYVVEAETAPAIPETRCFVARHAIVGDRVVVEVASDEVTAGRLLRAARARVRSGFRSSRPYTTFGADPGGGSASCGSTSSGAP
jgi:hypothetical protein